jgi:hypothetical protein
MISAGLVIICKKRKEMRDARTASVSPLVKKRPNKDISNSFVESLDAPDESEPFKGLHGLQ